MDYYKETNIPCFECGKNFGIDCPGRKPDEATRCQSCFEIFMAQMLKEQEEHEAEYFRQHPEELNS